MALKHATPMLDELEKGPWPSFVSDVKRMAAKGNHMCEDWLGLMELSYKEKEGHWKHGGIVGVFGYGGGVIGRYCDRPDLFPNVAHFHTMRVNQPASKYYNTEILRKLCDLWDAHGSGLTNMHGSTGDIVLLGTTTDQLEPVFYELTHDFEMDLGGSGSNLRTPEGCLGMSRCEWSCINTQDIIYDLTQEYQDALHRPMFPYKFKFKSSGCPMDCVAAIARSDCSIIGTWRDDIRIDQEAVKAYVGGELVPHAGAGGKRKDFDIKAEVIDLCPTKCMEYDGKALKIYNEDCVRCMHCIRVMPRALRPGLDTGRNDPGGRQGPHSRGRTAFERCYSVYQDGVTLHRVQGIRRKSVGLVDGKRQEPRTPWRDHSAPQSARISQGGRARTRSTHGEYPEVQSLHFLRSGGSSRWLGA